MAEHCADKDAPPLPHLLALARCPRCQTWVFIGDHSEQECQRWRALRSDPSHEHRWHVIDAKAASCLDCRTLAEIRYVIPPGANALTERGETS